MHMEERSLDTDPTVTKLRMGHRPRFFALCANALLGKKNSEM